MVDLIHVAATPAISTGSVGAAHGEGRPLVLAELVWDCRTPTIGVELPARNKGIRGTLPSMLATGATYRQGIGEGS